MGRREGYLASLQHENVAEPELKRCSKCGEWKRLGSGSESSEFHWRRRKLKSGVVRYHAESSCKKCRGAQNVAIRRREIADGVDVYARWKRWFAKKDERYRQTLLARKREAEAIRRRERGEQPRRGHYKRQYSKSGLALPVEPIALLLEREEEERHRTLIAERTGVGERHIYGIVKREKKTVSLAVIDQLLVGLGLPHELPVLYPET